MEDNKEIIAENENIIEEPKRSKMLRVVAILLLVFYVCLLGAFIYMVITGSRYIFAMIFVLIMFPLVLYIMVWLRKVFSK